MESSLAPFQDRRYLSLTSFKQNGTPVATPVWFVADEERLLVQTDDDSYKVKRIRRNPSVTVTVCTASGRLRSAAVPARAKLLGETEGPEVERLFARKYRYDMWIFRPLRALQTALGRRRGQTVYLAITPLDGSETSATS